jgi:excisionase family DNA binding protein
MHTQAKYSDQVEKLLYRPRTVAAMTDQSVSQVYKLISEGVMPSVRLGRSVRVPADALRRFVERLSA